MTAGLVLLLVIGAGAVAVKLWADRFEIFYGEKDEGNREKPCPPRGRKID